VAVILFLVMCLAQAAVPVGSASVTPALSMPNHLGLGIAGSDDGNGIQAWVPNSGVPWDYAYQYLSGGVANSCGWQTWNAQAKFPLIYAQDSTAKSYIPVFSYYMLLQSNTACSAGTNEPKQVLANLNSSTTMNAYFADFALLMKRLGPGTYGGVKGFGGLAIVQVEPDLSGFAQQAVLNNLNCFAHCTGQGNNPALLKASVASSGFADVAGFANTYQGFSWALLHLRDLYAPNVLLGFHVSDWATETDIGSDTRSNVFVNATALGQQVASFANASGVTTVPAGSTAYDLLFNDVSNATSGFKVLVNNEPTSSAWWDVDNVTFPNFHRWEQYVTAIHTATGKDIVEWQIPIGNQRMRTMNNSAGHYQDNRVEYLLRNSQEVVNSGVIALLFGAALTGDTVNYDGKHDGKTNPAAICNHNGSSSGTVLCTNKLSTNSDDDGGFMRIAGAKYYSLGPTPLP
jgi:hypothetical protein